MENSEPWVVATGSETFEGPVGWESGREAMSTPRPCAGWV